MKHMLNVETEPKAKKKRCAMLGVLYKRLSGMYSFFLCHN